MASCTAISPTTFVVALGLLLGTSRALTTTGPSPTIPELVECDETPPACNVSHKLTDGYPYTFTTPDHGYVESVYHAITINTQESVCSLDPMSFVSDITNRSTPLSLQFRIQCPAKPTRVVIQPSRNLTSPLVFSYLVVSNCTMYWKDLSRFGQHVDIKVLMLLNWKDEFVDQQPSLFQQCVELDDLQEGLEGVAPSISSLARVGSLLISSSHECSCSDDTPVFHKSASSPVFARNMWPRMAEVAFVGYAAALDLLPRTMPKLQTLVFRGLGRLAAPNVEFPWQENTLDLPLNLSRTENFNDQYSASLAIAYLPPSIYRRLLKLDGVVLPPDWNQSFTGFLHKIEVTGCNLTHVDSHTFTHTEDLQAIDLSRNKISHLAEKSFSGLSNLVTINLNKNHISSLPERIFDGLSSLANVLLQENHLAFIQPMIFFNLHGLKHIDLSGNKIMQISDEAMGRESSDFTQLTQINLSGNELVDFPIWLLQLRFLTDVDLSHNRISFEGFKSVLSRIPSAAYISYSNRQSSSSTDNYFLPASTKTITFQNNVFTKFNTSQLVDEELYNLHLLLNYFQLDFTGNALHCDCSAYTLYEYLSSFDTDEPRNYYEIGVLPYNMNSIICQHPPNLQGIPLVEAPITSIGCYQEVPRCPRDCQCWVRTVDEAVKVQCINNTLTELPEFLPDNAVELDFSGNALVSLPQDLPDYISSIDVLDFSDNLLDHLDGSLFRALDSTSEINLQGNKLTSLPTEVMQMVESLQLTLSGNRFICDCTTLWLKHWFLTRRRQILDIDEIICASGVPQGQTIIEVPDAEFVCVADTFPIIVSVSTVAAILALALVSLLLVYKYRGEIKIILYMKFGWHPFDCSDNTDIVGKEFDVFVSYCHEDNEWVCKELRPRLENSQPPFRLCLHERDFVAGAAVADNISAAINTSRRMVLLLSRAFLRSHWCYMEFRQAHYKVLKDRTNYLIVVLCDDVSTEDLDEDMHLYLKTNTYLSRDCHWFWKKLRYALPQKPLTELLEGKETKWKDGWSGLEALAEAQNEAHKKAMRKCQLQNGEKKHCCQYRKPENCHVVGGENHCNNACSIPDQFIEEQNERKDHQSTNMGSNQFSHGKTYKDQSSGETSDEETRDKSIIEDDVVLDIQFSECKNYTNEGTKL